METKWDKFLQEKAGKALDNIDLNQMSHRYVSGVLQNEPSTFAHLIDHCDNINLSLKKGSIFDINSWYY